MITVIDRETGRRFEEKVYGQKPMAFLYQSRWGHLVRPYLTQNWISRAYGHWQSSALSRNKIPAFIKTFGIPMDEYETKSGEFKSFNDFFIRAFKPGRRPFVQAAGEMPAFAEGRYLAYASLTDAVTFPVKGQWLRARDLLAGGSAAKFVGGPAFIARLCPVDYHRFHFPDAGRVVDSWRVPGCLDSVNPAALVADPRILIRNERHITLIETENFGTLAYVEVGALCVGLIRQTYDPHAPVLRGQEKGYFLFGASTVVLLGEPGAWTPHADLLRNTEQELETFVKLGSAIASAKQAKA